MTLTVQGNNNEQTQWMRTFQTDAESFGPHQMDMMKGYLHHTGMHTRMVEIFEEMSKPLMTSTSKKLVERYQKAHTQFKLHLKTRVECMENPKKASPLDPWFRLSVSTGKDDLRDISFLIQDLLFDIGLVVKFKIEEGYAIAVEEIKKLIKELPGYLEKLDEKVQSKLHSLIPTLQKLETKLVEIQKLKTNASEKNFKQASKDFSKIREELLSARAA